MQFSAVHLGLEENYRPYGAFTLTETGTDTCTKTETETDIIVQSLIGTCIRVCLCAV